MKKPYILITRLRSTTYGRISIYSHFGKLILILIGVININLNI